MLQPFWSLLMGHKAMLPILYALNPDHPNLLPAYFDGGALDGSKHIIKQANSSQGIGSRIISADGKIVADRRFREGKAKLPYHHIYQRYADGCEDPDGGFRVFHMFTADGEAAALGARVSPSAFVGGDDTQTKFMPVIIQAKARAAERLSKKEL